MRIKKHQTLQKVAIRRLHRGDLASCTVDQGKGIQNVLLEPLVSGCRGVYFSERPCKVVANRREHGSDLGQQISSRLSLRWRNNERQATNEGNNNPFALMV